MARMYPSTIAPDVQSEAEKHLYALFESGLSDSNSRSFTLRYLTKNQVLGRNLYENHFYFSRGAGIAEGKRPFFPLTKASPSKAGFLFA